MHHSTLQTLLRGVNRDGFRALDDAHGLTRVAATAKGACRIYPAPGPLRGGTLVDAPEHTGFDGCLDGCDATSEALEAAIHLASTNAATAHGRVAVGAVLDSPTTLGTDDPAADPDLPVILAVGINPGWQGQPPAPGRDFLSHPPSLCGDTGLRPRLEAVTGVGDGYHLVAASFFPWVTTEPWVKVAGGVLAEELLLRYLGWTDPLDFVVRLISELWAREALMKSPLWRNLGLTHVVFHGSDHTAARYGAALVGG